MAAMACCFLEQSPYLLVKGSLLPLEVAPLSQVGGIENPGTEEEAPSVEMAPLLSVQEPEPPQCGSYATPPSCRCQRPAVSVVAASLMPPCTTNPISHLRVRELAAKTRRRGDCTAARLAPLEVYMAAKVEC